MRVVVLGLSLSSSWGNGHATTYRALLRGLRARGHDVLFLERDAPWYAAQRDLPRPDFCRLALYDDLAELRREHAAAVRGADAVIVGSYVPDGVEVTAWVQDTARGVTAFYDIDTPVTLAALRAGTCAYLSPAAIFGFDLYLSFTGGPTLEVLEREHGARKALPLYCSVDPEAYYPKAGARDLDLGYLGTYSDDRQPALARLLLEPAAALPQARFAVVGPQYPQTVRWPANVARQDHLPPAAHRGFYNRQRFTLNVTRAAMVARGYSPSVRLFEAAACGTPIISDRWPGLDELFAPGREILIADGPAEVIGWLRDMDKGGRAAVGAAARRRVLVEHTGERRAAQLEGYLRGIPVAARSSSASSGSRVTVGS